MKVELNDIYNILTEIRTILEDTKQLMLTEIEEESQIVQEETPATKPRITKKEIQDE